MRDYKFRAWIKSLGVMADVLVIDSKDETVLLKGYKRDTIATFNQVDLMQFTGLSDINGVELYEGDIVVKNLGYEFGYIAFLPQEMGYVIVYKNYDERLGHRDTGSQYGFDSRLARVGNIYENPELIQ